MTDAERVLSDAPVHGGGRVLLEPATVEELSAALAKASREKLRASVHGAGTKRDWGPATQPVDLELSTRRLNAVLAHRHGDLTATVQAGATLADVNRELARHGQWLPLDPPFRDRATIGGIVATNDSGPRRQRYGAPRDLIIGVDIVRADGVAAKGGGIVVKNVAGYDIARLMTGSFGSLAVITSATFKLFPIPPASRTVVIESPLAQLAEIAASLASSQLTPTAIEIETSPMRLLVRFESIEAAADQQAAAVAKSAADRGAAARIVSGDDEVSLWDAHGRPIWDTPGAVVKMTMLPGDVAAALTWIAGALTGVDWDAAGRFALGVLLVRVDASVAKQANFINDLRARFAPGRGSAVIVRGSDNLKAVVDVWGPLGGSLTVMRAVKTSFDPDGILPARF
ncbi:MAG TPA: FAD-binding oxidoreductase [Vicinamibacterales bacterium]|nr:FAD-binding oxidoreductase [Vicinamibacterales bacterium]